MPTRTNTARSRDHLREQGYLVGTGEHWDSHARVRKDLLGFVDLVGVGKGEMLLVQTTTVGSMSARLNKIKNDCRAEAIECLKVPGVRILIHGWRGIYHFICECGYDVWYPKAASSCIQCRQMMKRTVSRWSVKEREVTMEDLQGG